MSSPADDPRIALQTSAHELAARRQGIDLTVLIPAINEGPNLRILVPWLQQVLNEEAISYEMIVVTSDDDRDTAEAAMESGALVLVQTSKGYGGALVDGLRKSSGDYVLTLDADLSHRPQFVRDMWRSRQCADVVIASRYVPGGTAAMPRGRRYLSKGLNLVFRRGISVPVRDLSSGFRLYRREIIDPDDLSCLDFDVLEEIVVKATCEGWRVREIPFDYMPRRHGSSSARVTRLFRAYVRSFWTLWKLRNSIAAADYDYRAYSSPIPLQRYWQRERYRIARDMIAGEGPVLDVGCGSSRIMELLPQGSVGLDILIRKLRFNRRFGVTLVNGSGFELPFRDASFSCVLSSQVIEHVPKESPMIDELCRVLKPGGRLVIGTPDYARKEWVYLEKLYAMVAPGAYADEHIAHYSRDELVSILETKGMVHETSRYVARGELIAAFRRPVEGDGVEPGNAIRRQDAAQAAAMAGAQRERDPQ
jgi:dolichol-phosphate mannosyltransferase